MADAPISYGIVAGAFIFLGGLLFALGAKGQSQKIGFRSDSI